MLEQFPYLSLSDSDEHANSFSLNSSTLCPLCNGDHKEERIWNDIRGKWMLVNIAVNELIVSNAGMFIVESQ